MNNISGNKNLLIAEQVKQLYRNLPASNSATLAIGLFLIWTLWSVTPPSLLVAWYSYILLVAVIRSLLAYQYKQFSEEKGSPRFWLTSYMCGVLASGLGWGATLIFLVPVDSTLHLVSLVFLICGLVTGSVASLSSIKYGFSVFSLPSLLPGMVYLATLDAPYSSYLSFCILLFLIFITFIASGIHKTILYSMNQQLTSAKSLVHAEEEKDILMEKCIRLEKELELSNKKLLKLKENYTNENVNYASTLNENDLSVKDDKLKLLFESIDGGVWDWNVKTGKTVFSDGWLRMLGYSKKDIDEHIKFWESLLHPDECMEVLNRLHLYSDGKHSSYFSTHRMKNKSGGWSWVISRGFAIAWGSYGEVLNIIGMDINIADSNEELAHMLYMSTHNAADLISNVENFRKQLHRVLQTTRNSDLEHVVCYISIDISTLPVKHNKAMADEFSRQFVRLLLNKCRKRDTIVSFGEYSFGLLMEHCSLDVAWQKTKTLYNILTENKFNWEGNYYNLNISIGLTPISASSNDVEQIIEDAQLACIMAKEKQPDKVYIFQRDDYGHVHNIIEKEFVDKIQDALKNERFHIVSKPLKSISESSRNSTEQLFNLKLKFTGNKINLLSDEDIVLIIKRNDLAVCIDKYFMGTFFKWIYKQPKKYNNSQNVYLMSLNECSIKDQQFIKFISRTLEENKSLAQSICFIFTYGEYLSNYKDINDYIEQLRTLGCKFALENIGVDSLSQEYIKKATIDYVKIDSELISTVQTDSASLSAIKYINEISHIMNLKTIAENVDDDLLLESLMDIGVDYVSGKATISPKPILI